MENGQDEVPISYLNKETEEHEEWQVQRRFTQRTASENRLGREHYVQPWKTKEKAFKYRTTLRTRYEEEQIVWKEMDFFKCAKEWSVKDYGEYRSPCKKKKTEEKRDVEMEPQEQEDLWKGRSKMLKRD